MSKEIKKFGLSNSGALVFRTLKRIEYGKRMALY